MGSSTRLAAAVSKLQEYYSGLARGTFVGVKADAAKALGEKWKGDIVADFLGKLDTDVMFQLYSDEGDALMFKDMYLQFALSLTALRDMRICFETAEGFKNPLIGMNQMNLLLNPMFAALAAIPPSVIQIIGAESPDPINSSTGDPQSHKTNLGAVSIAANSMSPQMAKIQASVIMFNYMPAVELSRAMPYLRMYQGSKNPGVDRAGNITGPSLIRFLGPQNIGLLSGQGLGPAAALATGVPADEMGDSLNAPAVGSDFSGITGMEIFMAPQTMVNANSGVVDPGGMVANRATDKFAPFMTLTRCTFIEKSIQVGAMCDYMCDLTFKLHDRARMPQISRFLEPGELGTTKWVFQFGWSHPGGSVYGDMLNACRQQWCGITNKSTYSLDSSGGVDVTVHLSGAGNSAVRNAHIFEGEFISEQRMAALYSYAIARLSQQVMNHEGLTQSVKTQGRITTRPGLGSRVYHSQIAAALIAFLDQPNPKGNIPLPDLEALNLTVIATLLESSTDIVDLTGKPDGFLSSVLTAGRAFNRKLVALKNGIDPFLKKIPLADGVPKDFGAMPENVTTGEAPSLGYVSFGKLALMFYGHPIANTQSIEEVQLFFCPVNNRAGFANMCTIDQLPIPMNKAIAILKEAMSDARKSTYCSAVFKRLIDEILHDSAYELYQAPPGPTASTKDAVQAAGGATPSPDPNEETAAVNRTVNSEGAARTEQAGGMGTTVEIPDITIRADTTTQLKNGKTTRIMRIFFMDAKAGPFQLEQYMLQQEGEGSLVGLDTIQDGATSATAFLPTAGDVSGEESKNSLKRYLDLGIIKKNPTSGVPPEYTMNASVPYKQWKATVMSFLPTIRFGASGNTINSVSTNMRQDQAMTNIRVYEAGQAETPPNAGEEGSEFLASHATTSDNVFVLPSSLTISCAGNPAVRFGQQYFVNFDTGTSLDTIYMVTGVQHTIDANHKFTTQVTLTESGAGGITNIAANNKALIAKSAAGAVRTPLGTLPMG